MEPAEMLYWALAWRFHSFRCIEHGKCPCCGDALFMATGLREDEPTQLSALSCMPMQAGLVVLAASVISERPS